MIIAVAAVALIVGGLGILFLNVWGLPIMGLAALVVVWALWFFRDPQRVTPPGLDLVVSPADGKVIKVDRAPMPAELRGPGVGSEQVLRVAIFLNIFNVHVNRSPAAGKVTKVVYTPGKFFTASLDKASEHNERSAVLLTDPRGRQIAFSQIAGWVARRIVNHLREGQQVVAGERFGLIRFGSRAEIFLPLDTEILVQVGDRVVAGESLLAKLSPPRGMVEPTVRTSATSMVGGAVGAVGTAGALA